MPYVDGKLVSPEDAHAAGRCAECGDNLQGLNIASHNLSHWPHLDEDEPTHADAIKRRDLNLAVAKPAEGAKA